MTSSSGPDRTGTGPARPEPEQAWEARDIVALIGLLDPDATAVADGGGKANAALRPIEGGEQVARYLAAIVGRTPRLTILEAAVNGQDGLVVRQDGVTVTVLAFDIAADQITRIWIIRNPGKLSRWAGGLEGLQVVRDLERGAGGLAELVDVAVGRQGGQHQPVVGHVEHREVGDDLVDDAAAGQRQ